VSEQELREIIVLFSLFLSRCLRFLSTIRLFLPLKCSVREQTSTCSQPCKYTLSLPFRTLKFLCTGRLLERGIICTTDRRCVQISIPPESSWPQTTLHFHLPVRDVCSSAQALSVYVACGPLRSLFHFRLL
jgi:hypothetical protein